MSVRAATVDPPERRGGWTTDTDRRLATLESPVRSVLETDADSLSYTDRITLIPDAHYPFHPSTGIVTDPAVVGSVAAVLQAQTGADITVAGATDDNIAFDRAASYLGYPSVLERFGVELADLADESRQDRVVSVADQQLSVSVPERLLESTVIAVPTLRPTRDGSVAGGMRTLGRLVTSVADADQTAVGATRAIEPAFTLLDATTAYGGDPIAADTLFAGPTPQIDALAASLFGRSPETDPVCRQTAGDDDSSITVESVTGGPADLTSLRRRLSDGELPPPDDTHPAVSTAYRLYAAVAGDAVPPQLEQRR